MHLWLGSGEVESLEVEQFGAYWRRLRRRLADVLADPADDDGPAREVLPLRVLRVLPAVRGHLAGGRLAGLRGRHPEERRRTPSRTPTSPRWSSWRRWTVPPRGSPPPVRIDCVNRPSSRWSPETAPEEPPGYRPVPPGDDPVWGHGYGNLPEPDPGDVYFDLEGHPFWTASTGLFFLFGLWYQVDGEWIYEARWAHDLDAQSAAAAELVEFFDRRRQDHPGFHVYHYNHTERSALAAMTLGTPSEALFTHLSDTGLFVDLMTVATNSFQVGVESYGLKSLEALAGYQRHGDIEGGAGAVVDYDQYMTTGDPDLLDAIAQYNEDDVRATHALHGWLLDHRPPDPEWRESVLDGYDEDPELDPLVEQLLASDPGTLEHLLGELLGYWRRERSADVGPKFAKLEADTQDAHNDRRPAPAPRAPGICPSFRSSSADSPDRPSDTSRISLASARCRVGSSPGQATPWERFAQCLNLSPTSPCPLPSLAAASALAPA